MKKRLLYFTLILMAENLYASVPFRLIGKDIETTIHYGGDEPVINTAIEMLVADSKQVCDHPFGVTDNRQKGTIIIGIPEQESTIKDLTSACRITTSDLSGKWEAYKIQVADVNGRPVLFVLGSDPRGTAYGVLELSRQMGVTPWVWWADVVPEKKKEVTIDADGTIHSPSVTYRGIFLNDEDWALSPWSTRTFEPTSRKGAIGPKTYEKIFELLLRLRANTIWPAMHECTVPFFAVEGNREMAQKYGIVLSTSHAEPMMRTNTGEWDNLKYGAFNFLSNKDRVLSYWDERIRQLPHTEYICTIGMRGIHDGRMQGVNTLDEETKVLSDVIGRQREILKKHNPERNIASIPQIFVPYKEVLKAYENGLTLPEDVTLVWCDDNHGYIMQLSDEEEQKRSGGGGVYYHISYWGKPHDYLWLASTQPGLIYTEMKRAWDNGARRLWILNAGDIKPGEYLTEFFLDMAWDIGSFSGNTIYAHLRDWLEKVFPGLPADKMEYILHQYYHLAGQRKPEHMGWNRVEDPALWSRKNEGGLQPIKDSELSLTEFGDEIDRRIRAYDTIKRLSADILEKEVPHQLKAAYFQLVHYPVAASDAMNRKILYAQKARFYAATDVELANYYAQCATDAYEEIALLDYIYNKDMSDGKWELMMDMKPRDLPVFQRPVFPELPVASYGHTQLRLPQTTRLVETAGTPTEGDRMIALNACMYTNNIQVEHIEGLGHSGMAVRLPAATHISPRQPHLEYRIKTISQGDANIKIGLIPQHPVHGETARRYAIVIDKQKPLIVSTAEAFLSDKWAENVLRNQSLTITKAVLADPGEHLIRIYALDEELLVDQLMLDFDLDRKHYLIPADSTK